MNDLLCYGLILLAVLLSLPVLFFILSLLPLVLIIAGLVIAAILIVDFKG